MSNDTEPKDPRVGELIASRFRLDERIGAGAMGLVYAAFDLDLGRRVAIKLMRTDLLVRDTSLARFEREATTLAAVRHQSVVTVYDRGVTEDGAPYLAMELIEGTPCSVIVDEARRRGQDGGAEDDDSSWLTEAFGIDVLSERSFLRQVVRWMVEVAGGLAAAHAAGVVHRDLKPSNIIIQPDGRAVLIDFGVATAPDFRGLTGDDEIIGTPVYMAPETLRLGQPFGPQADVYGLAATLYHMLTLEAPFKGSVNEVLRAVATQDPVPAWRLRPGIPRDAQAILDHGMARAPGSRYPSLAAMESDLRALLAHRPVSVRPTGSLTRWIRRVRRSRLLVGAAASALVIAGAWGTWQWTVRAQARRVAVSQGLWEEVPSNFGVIHPANRFIRDAGLRASVGATFDRLVETGHQVEMALTMRAAYRVDHGLFEGAASDMERLADLAPGPVAQFLAEGYQVIAQEHSPAPPDGEVPPRVKVALEGVPDFESPLGRYLTGFHWARLRKYDRASSILNDPSVDGWRHVQALRLMFGARDIALAGNDVGDDPAAPDALRHMLEDLASEARDLMARSGYGGAGELNALAFVRSRQGRLPECLSACEEGLARSPASISLLQNGAEAALHMGELERAKELAEAGLRVVPGYAAISQTLAMVLVEMGDFDGARRVLGEANYGRSARAEVLRNAQRLRVAVAEADAFTGQDPERAAMAVARGEELCELLPEDSPARASALPLLDGLSAGDRSPYFRAALTQLVERPTSVTLFWRMRDAWPQSISPTDAELLDRWFESLDLQRRALTGVTFR